MNLLGPGVAGDSESGAGTQLRCGVLHKVGAL